MTSSLSLLQEAQVTLSFTNPVENLLKVTLLNIEEDEKDAVAETEKEKQDEGNGKGADSKMEEGKKDDTEKTKEDGAKDKEQKNVDDEGKNKEEGSEKAADDKKQESSVGVMGINRKFDRSIDNSCEGRSFVPTAQVKYVKFFPISDYLSKF